MDIAVLVGLGSSECCGLLARLLSYATYMGSYSASEPL